MGGYFADTSLSSWQRIVSVNLMGVVHCCRALVPEMVSAGRSGHIVNIASMLGYVGVQGVTAYCATKFGVVGFSESNVCAQNWQGAVLASARFAPA